MKILSVVLVILMGLDVSTLLSNISSFRQVYIPSAVKTLSSEHKQWKIYFSMAPTHGNTYANLAPRGACCMLA